MSEHTLHPKTLVSPRVRLVAEPLERLIAKGLVSVMTPLDIAARVLDEELDLIQLIPTAELSAAIVALRTAGWPPAQSRTPDMLTGTTDTALTVSSMLERESPRHVADFLRYAEAGITGQAMRSIESVLPEATRAIEAYRELTGASDSPNDR